MKVGLGHYGGNGVGSFRVWLSSARGNSKRSQEVHIKEEDPRGDRESRRGGGAGEGHLEAQGMEVCRREMIYGVRCPKNGTSKKRLKCSCSVTNSML